LNNSHVFSLLTGSRISRLPAKLNSIKKKAKDLFWTHGNYICDSKREKKTAATIRRAHAEMEGQSGFGIRPPP
jgi:hypothetical protein